MSACPGDGSPSEGAWPGYNPSRRTGGMAMAILLSHGGWGMPTVPIDVAVEHCARLGFDGYTIAVKSGWTTDAANLDAAERKRILGLFDQHGLTLAGISGQTSLLPD